MSVTPPRTPRAGLSRAAVVEAALQLVRDEGLDALSMRPLADRLGVKPASLYWHVRDRGELMELLADAILAEVPSVKRRSDWRSSVLAVCAAMSATIGKRRDAARIILEVPASVERSDAFSRIVSILQSIGLENAAAHDAATMMLTFIIVRPQVHADADDAKIGELRRIAIDSGSRGVVVRSGGVMDSLVRVARDPSAPSPGVVRGDTIVVRRMRGNKRGEIELNAAHPWTFRIQGPTWNTTLDLGGIDVRGIHFDSGAAKVECILPHPSGIVPIQVSGGVLKVVLQRPPGTPITVDISAGAVKLQLDGMSIPASTDMHWESPGASALPDRYELRISGGAAGLTLDASANEYIQPTDTSESHDAAPWEALDLLLDGIESRTISLHKLTHKSQAANVEAKSS